MVIYSFANRRWILRAYCRQLAGGFSLLEVVLALFILGIMAAALAPSVRDGIERARETAEARSIDELAATVGASFQATDLTNVNIAALAGTIGTADTATAFSASTSAPYATTANNDWFAKVARLRGVTPAIGTAPSAAAQPALYRIAFNEVRNPRLVFAAPSETGQQRFMILSLTARSDQLALPPYETTATWFDAIWTHDWTSQTADVPAYWVGKLTAPQRAAWLGSGGTTSIHRLIVRRITLQKYKLTINNNHATERAWLSYNNTAQAFTAAPNSGANVSPEILGGRLVTLNRGATWPGVEALRFHINTNDAVTLQ